MKAPNVLVTGTPGAGKTHFAKTIAEHSGMEFLEISKIVSENGFTDGYDDTLECPILDEDKLLDYLEPLIAKGGNVVEYHSSEFFPKRFFQAVYVVQCDTNILFKRLEQRGYNATKIRNNIECEIFQMPYEEATSSYDKEIVKAVRGETEEDMQENLKMFDDFLNSVS
ncbi:unnamed protein product [Diamesa tonsa]